jgi:L-methionine (R)-S-oxide reductase
MVEQIRTILSGHESRGDKARLVAERIRESGNYRWVGVYDVTPAEISVVGWSGPGAPKYPHFPATKGLCGAAAATGQNIIVGDVTKDPRYLTTLGNTRSEMIVLIRHPATGKVCGLIDVESEQVNAFTAADRSRFEKHASAIATLWKS